jgi:dihydroorotase
MPDGMSGDDAATPAVDLLLRGGTVIDPATGLRERADVSIDRGVIHAVGDLGHLRAASVIDVRGSLVTPGLVDLHTHVISPGAELSAEPDLVGVRAGVTTVVDAGSAGPETIPQLRSVVAAAQTRVVPFLHIGRVGMFQRPDVVTAADIDVDLLVRSVAEASDLVHGIKVRLVSPALENLGLGVLKSALEAGRQTGLRLMVHIGDIAGRADPAIGGQALEMLRPGDIVTHVFTAHPGGVLDPDGNVIPQAWAAAERGVLFDAAHGMNNLSFDVARKVLDQGLPLHGISTDMTAAGRGQTVFSLVEVMSRYLMLGLTQEEIIDRVTWRPALAAGIAGEAGRLAPGRQADVSVLDVRETDAVVHDSSGAPLRLTSAFVPRLTVIAGETVEPDGAPHPWGWAPAPSEPGR